MHEIFLGYSKHYSVTAMLLELRLPSCRTVLLNSASVFRCMVAKCHNRIVQFLAGLFVWP